MCTKEGIKPEWYTSLTLAISLHAIRSESAPATISNHKLMIVGERGKLITLVHQIPERPNISSWPLFTLHLGKL